MKHNYILNSKRLKLRQVKPDDLKYLMNWRNQDTIKKWFFSTDLITKKQQLDWYAKYLKDNTDIMFILERQEYPNTPIGTAGLYQIDSLNHSAEFGRLMIGNQAALGKGLGKESTEIICCFALNDLNLDKIYLEVFKKNKKAVKIYDQLGFTATKEYFKNQSKVLYMVLDSSYFKEKF